MARRGDIAVCGPRSLGAPVHRTWRGRVWVRGRGLRGLGL